MTLPAPSMGRESRPWRVALVGTGLMGSEHLRCLGTLPSVEVVAVVDQSAVLAEAIAERFDIPQSLTDHRRMLDEVAPDVVHITTPPTTHFQIAYDSLAAGAHAFVEKPITATHAEWEQLRDWALQAGRRLVENQTYLFDRRILKVDELMASGEWGRVSHVDVRFLQNANGAARSPTVSVPGGVVADLLPHLAGLAHHFVGRHNTVSTLWHGHDQAHPTGEFLALVDAERGSATIGVNPNSRPEGLWVSVYGSRMQARINLYEGRLSLDRALGGPSPLVPVRNGLAEGWGVARAALTSLWGKVTGTPGSYEGFWELARRFYAGLSAGSAPPLGIDDIDAVSLLVARCLEGQE